MERNDSVIAEKIKIVCETADKEEAQEAFACVREALHSLLMWYLAGKVSSPDDTAQEIWLRMWQVLRSGKYVENFRAYLMKAAYHQWISEHRKDKNEEGVSSGVSDGVEQVPDKHPSVVEIIVQQEAWAQFREYVENLEQPNRAIAFMKLEGKPSKEIAKAVELNVNQVDQRWHRIVKGFRPPVKSGAS